jgi:hypothetical protein
MACLYALDLPEKIYAYLYVEVPVFFSRFSLGKQPVFSPVFQGV